MKDNNMMPLAKCQDKLKHYDLNSQNVLYFDMFGESCMQILGDAATPSSQQEEGQEGFDSWASSWGSQLMSWKSII